MAVTIEPRKLTDQAVPPDSGGLFNVLNSLRLDTSVGQFITNFDQLGFFQLDPTYLPAADPRLSDEPWLWDLIKDARSEEHANSIIVRARRNNRIRGSLEHGGATWSRFFSSFLDPVNFIPIPLIGGVGFLRGAARGAALIGGTNLATETARTLIDPTDTSSEFLLNVGSGFVLGAAFGGALGALPRSAFTRTRRPPDQATPTSGIRPDTNAELAGAARRYDAAFHEAPRGRAEESVPAPARPATAPGPSPAPRQGAEAPPGPRESVRPPVEPVEPVLSPQAKAKLPIDPDTGVPYTGPHRMLQRTRQIQAELRALEAVETPAAAMRARQLGVERMELEQALVDPEIKASLEDSIDRGPLTQAERDEFPADSRPDNTLPPEGMRQVLREDRARLTNERDVVAAQRAETETKIAELRQRAAATDNPQQRGRFLGKRMRRLEGQRTALNERLSTIDNSIETLTDAISAHDVSEIGSARLDKNIGKPFNIRALPGFRMLNNRFVGALGERIARDFNRIANLPGLRTAGARLGIGAGEASVEALKFQHIRRYKEALDKMGTQYLEYIGKPRSSVQSGIFVENLRQGKDNVLASMPEFLRRKLNIADTLVRDNLYGKRTWNEFKRDVMRYRVSPETRGEFDPELQPFLEEANRAWSTFTKDMAKDLDELGIFASKKNAQKRLEKMTNLQDRLARIIEEKSNRLDLITNAEDVQATAIHRRFIEENPDWAGMDVTTWRARYKSNLSVAINAAKTQKDKISRWREEAEGWLEAVQSGLAESAEAYTHRIWLKVDDTNRDALTNVLADHFEQNLTTRFGGKIVQRSDDPNDIRERAELAVRNIEGGTDGSSQAQRSFSYERLESQIDEIEVRLAPFESRSSSQAPPATIVEGPTSVGVRGTDSYRPAFTTYNGDGTWTINLDREQLRIDYREKARTARKWANFFDDADKFVEFVERHERAHTRLRKGDLETRSEYEQRINREAWLELNEGETPRTNAMADLQRQRRDLQNDLTREKLRGASTPGMMLGRRLDIPDSKVLDFIETDIEASMSLYVDRLAPVIELTKKFGDHRLDGHLTDLAIQMEQAIELAPSAKQAQLLAKERDEILTAYEDLRDVVMGRMNIPEDPDRIDQRAWTFLRNWALMSQMGKAWQAAIPDVGRIVLQEGSRRTFSGLWNATFQGLDRNSAWARGAEEARLAGLALEIATGYRWQAMTGVKFQGATRTAMERFAERGARGMFLVNGLAHWTDNAEKFTSTLIIDRILKAAGRAADGTATSKDITELAEFGIDVSSGQHNSIVNNWRGTADTTPELLVDGLAIANTSMWRNQDVAHEFRGMLNAAVKSAVLTPGAADRPTFMSKPHFQAIFLYKMFALGATHRILLAGLQGKHAHLVAGISSMIALGAVVDAVRRPDWAETNIGETLYRAIDRSGVTGLVLDINNTIESLSYNAVGINPALGLTGMRGARDPNIAEAIGAVAGPAVNQWAYMAWAMTSPEADADEVARATRYMIPYNNWFMVSDLFTSVQRQAADVFEGAQ